jgi:ferredoxin
MPRVTVRFLDAHPQAREGDRTLDVDDGAVLLDALAARGVIVQTLCGGAMDCRTCVVFVDALDGAASPMGVKERALLVEKGAREVRSFSSARFSCQVRVRGDLVVTVPPPSAAPDHTLGEGEIP